LNKLAILVAGLALSVQPAAAQTLSAVVDAPRLIAQEANSAITESAPDFADAGRSPQTETQVGECFEAQACLTVPSDNGRSPELSQQIASWAHSRPPAVPFGPSLGLTSQEQMESDRRTDEAISDCLENCPPASLSRQWTDHVPLNSANSGSFWQQVGTVKYEVAGFLAFYSAMGVKKLGQETQSFRFKNEGWFGKNTASLGVDKLAHAYNAYMLSELLHHAIHDRGNAPEGDALTAAILATGLTALNELSDGIEKGGGYSMQDIAMNLGGAGFSLLRNSVPGLKEKVAFKLEIMPNREFYTFSGKAHFQQQRFFLAFKGSGFEGLKKTPLRFLDLQLGYYASEFTLADRAAGREPKRHLFVGIGLNLSELVFGRAKTRLGKIGYEALDYFQPPYTSLRADTTGRVGW
jgi:Predicted periplasmic lipoprotein (DUF2279)